MYGIYTVHCIDYLTVLRSSESIFIRSFSYRKNIMGSLERGSRYSPYSKAYTTLHTVRTFGFLERDR